MKISNIAELKTRRGTTGSNVNVLGYYSSGDGGGGEFYWDNSSTETDNGGTIIKVTALTTGRWKRIIDKSHINVLWFGAVNGTTDSIVAINKSIEYAFSERIGEVKLNGKFRVSSSILLYPSINLNGTSSGFDNNAGTEISVTVGFNGHIIKSKFDETNAPDMWQHWGGISDISIIGDNQLTGCGIKIYRAGENFLITKIQVFRTASHGVMIYDASTPCHVGYISCHWCGHRDNGAGLYIENAIQTSVQILYLAGDNNKLGLLKLKNIYQSSVFLQSFKSERSDFSSTNPLMIMGHDDVIVVENGNGGILTIGAGKVWVEDNKDSTGSVIKNYHDGSSSNAQIQILGSIGVSIDPTNGVYAYDYNGEVTVPFNTFVNVMGVHELGRLNTMKGSFSTTGLYKYGSSRIKGIGTVSNTTESTDGLSQVVVDGVTGGQMYNAKGDFYISQGSVTGDIIITNNAGVVGRIYPNGNMSFGDALSNITSAIANFASTTKGFLPPKVTTTQKNAIASPVSGLMVYDTTLNKLCVYEGSSWKTITTT